jgi:hypothetical protein
MKACELLVEGFLKVSYDRRIVICKELGLITEEDIGSIRDSNWMPLWKKAFRVVREKRLHSDLWVKLYHDGVVHRFENPFDVADLIAELCYDLNRGVTSREQLRRGYPEPKDLRETARNEAERLKGLAAAGLVDREKEKEAETLAHQCGFTDPARKAFNPMDGFKVLNDEIRFHNTTVQGLQVAKEIEATISCVYDTGPVVSWDDGKSYETPSSPPEVDVMCHDGTSYKIPSIPPELIKNADRGNYATSIKASIQKENYMFRKCVICNRSFEAGYAIRIDDGYFSLSVCGECGSAIVEAAMNRSHEKGCS